MNLLRQSVRYTVLGILKEREEKEEKRKRKTQDNNDEIVTLTYIQTWRLFNRILTMTVGFKVFNVDHAMHVYLFHYRERAVCKGQEPDAAAKNQAADCWSAASQKYGTVILLLTNYFKIVVWLSYQGTEPFNVHCASLLNFLPVHCAWKFTYTFKAVTFTTPTLWVKTHPWVLLRETFMVLTLWQVLKIIISSTYLISWRHVEKRNIVKVMTFYSCS